MTLYAWARRRRFPRLGDGALREFGVGSKDRVTARCHWHPERAERPSLVILHGLEGSVDSHYVRGMADKAFSAGLNVVRLNQRGCGGSELLSVGCYHSGLTADPIAVVRELVERDGLRRIAVAGYSLGGNVALRMAGELGEDVLPEVFAFAAVSPALDLPACADALERRSNWLYQQNFLLDLRRRVRLKARLFPDVYSTSRLRLVRSVRQFDDAYTAPMSGFRDAADYYYRASALRVIGNVRRPALIISAEDDPFIPIESMRAPEIESNPAVTLLATAHGGHCGFVSALRNGAGDDGYWAERMVVRFVSAGAAR
jgi:predicted alpha/beta-fold hydrolase